MSENVCHSLIWGSVVMVIVLAILIGNSPETSFGFLKTIWTTPWESAVKLWQIPWESRKGLIIARARNQMLEEQIEKMDLELKKRTTG